MPTAEELLAVTPDHSTDSAESANRFIISEDLRTITVPKGQEVLGVTNDSDVRRVWFTMSRECDGTDLSGFTPFVNYINAAYNSGTYRCNDLAVDGDTISFSWFVSRRVAEADGTVRFNVDLKLFDNDGSTVLKEFNSGIASGIIVPGLSSSSEEDVDPYIDELMQLLEGLVDDELDERSVVTHAPAVATKTLLPTANVPVGQMRNVTDTGRNYVFDGTAWDDVGGLDKLTITTVTDAQIDAMFA